MDYAWNTNLAVHGSRFLLASLGEGEWLLQTCFLWLMMDEDFSPSLSLSLFFIRVFYDHRS